MIYLSSAELLHIAKRAIGAPPGVRDIGLLEAAAARPQASAFGSDAYPTLVEKAAALTHSLARNHALVDGNKRLALAGLVVFLRVNGRRLTMTNDEAYDFIIAIAQGTLDDIASIAGAIFFVTRNGEPTAELRPVGADRPRFVYRDEIAALNPAAVRIDRHRFRADLDEALDQGL